MQIDQIAVIGGAFKLCNFIAEYPKVSLPNAFILVLL
jgi:hypothetical protein